MQKNTNSITRRKFIKSTALVSTGFYIVPRHVLGRGYTPPSDQLYIAGIGVGNRGYTNLLNSFNNNENKIVSLCDVDDRLSVDARNQWNKATYYKDFRKLLDKEYKNIDAVIVSIPDHQHAFASVGSMQLGKHVYCESPLTHDVYEARALKELSHRYKVVTQMGNQESNNTDSQKIQKCIQDGLIGNVKRVHVWTTQSVWTGKVVLHNSQVPVPKELEWLLWLGSAPEKNYNPEYLQGNWKCWIDFGTGNLGFMGPHLVDIPYRALNLGLPVSIECGIGTVSLEMLKEKNIPSVYPRSTKIHLLFKQINKPDIELIWYDGGAKPERPLELLPQENMGDHYGGMIFEGTKYKLMAGLYGKNPALIPSKLNQENNFKNYISDLGKKFSHQIEWANACKRGYGTPTSSSFDVSGGLTESLLLGNLSLLSYNYGIKNSKNELEFPGRIKLDYDSEKMTITNFAPANEFIKRKYRDGWSLNV